MKIVHLKYKIKTGIHSGYLKMGFIDRTNYYIMPQVMMGAAINKLTRMLYSSPAQQHFLIIGNYLYKNLKFTPFFVSDYKDNVYCPDDSQCMGEKQWGTGNSRIGSDEFEYNFIRSYTGTAIDYSLRAAKNHTLHETEYIASRDRDGKQVYLTGYAIIFPGSNSGDGAQSDNKNDSTELKEFQTSSHHDIFKKYIHSIQIGGDRNYGMGQIDNDLCDIEDLSKACLFKSLTIGDVNDYQFDVSLLHNKPVGLPFKYCHQNPAFNNSIKGNLIPNIQREYVQDRGFGKGLKHRLFWEPGFVVSEEQKSIKVKIDDRGYWEIVKS